MKASSPAAGLLRGLMTLALVLTAVLFFSPPEHIRGVLAEELASCPQNCRGAAAPAAVVHAFFEKRRRTLANALCEEPVPSDPLGRAERHAQAAFAGFVQQRLKAAEGLVVLFCVRLRMLAACFALLGLFLTSTLVDAALCRRIAHQSFEASRPAVSFLSAAGFFTAVCLSAGLFVLPISGAGLACAWVLACSALGLHGWVRYFHRL